MSKTVFAFGRMNPPTIGHEKLVAKLESEAKRRGAMPHLYLSHSQNPKKDPLSYNTKIAIARKAFGKMVTKSSSKNIIQILQELEKMGHTEVALIAGSDRVPEFKSLLNKYNGKEYNFKKIEVISAGERDPDSEGVSGMSASKLRALAKEGDYNSFAKGMPSKLRDSDKKKVYDSIRSAMESFVLGEAPRIPRKKGQPAGSDKHSDLYTDENPEGTIHGLKFATEKDAEASVAKIKSSDRTHAHKIQAAIAMEQRAKVAGKKAAAAVYRSFINDMKKKTKEMNEAFELKLERDKRSKLLVLHVKDTKTGNRSEVRGKPGYEIDGYDPKDKLHRVLDKIGKSANMSDLMNGEKVTINPNHPKAKEALKMAKEITTEDVQWDDVDPTDEELDEILDGLDDELSWEWEEEQLDLELEEDRQPLTLAQRMKRKILMKRLAPQIQRKRKIKMRRKAGKEDLKKRARKAAILLLKKKVAGQKGADYKSLSPTEKIGIDKRVQKKLGAVDKIAKRLMPKMIKKETERVKAMRSGKTNEAFEMLFEKPKVAQDPDVDERPGSQPKKYFSGVRSKSKEARAKHFERGTKMDDDNPAAYKPAPGDAGAKTKPSKHTKKFKQMFGEDINEAFERIMTGLDEAAEYLEEKQIDALKKKSEKTGIPYGILKQVYNRGMAAWRTGHRPGTTPQQWAFARVNSFATKSKGTWGGADKDLAAKARGSMKKEEVSEADPCWDGYTQVGMKKGAGGKMVPNCVPEEVELDESALLDTKVIKTFPAPKRGGEVIIRKHNKENKFFVRLKYIGKSAKGSRPENLGTFSSLNDAMKKIKKLPFEVELEEKVEFEKDKEFSNLRKPKKTTKFELDKELRKKSKREAVSPAQQAAIAIAKKKSGKYDDEGKRIEEGSDILQSPRDGIRLIVRKHTDGKRYVLKMMTQNKPGEPKILSKKDAEKQISALKRLGWKKATNEEGGAGEEGTYELVRKYKKDTPMQESDVVNALKKDHDKEKERLKDKHDREMDNARLRDTRSKNMDEEFESLFEEPCCDDCLDEDYGWTEETDLVVINEAEAEYQGRKVKLNNPTRSDNPKKKTMVYVKNDKGNVVKVYFGDPNMSIKRDDPERRKNFRARHNCDNPGPKWKPRYWSCKFWSSKKVSDLMKG